MIFSSYPFIFGFLPAVLLITALLARSPRDVVIVALALASIVFYGYWNWHFLWVLISSVLVNYLFAEWIARAKRHRTLALTLGVGFDIAFLGYFKYSNFFIQNFDDLFGGHLSHIDIVLPLGISFFTFQMIGYLVDVKRGKVIDHSFQHFLLFVTFFPQLIAGPIVHHSEVIKQFVSGQAGRLRLDSFSQGLAIFVLGVAKKVLIADRIAVYATPVFQAGASGVKIPLVEAWCGTLAYAFQIYFDFSAYSDMAVGLGLMFAVRLPVNFNSPYKSASLIEFWRRWHITLSHFLRDYLYIPLGGNRKGEPRRYGNLLTVMVLAGLWHGAAWTFVAWGTLHGIGLALNHLWRTLRYPKKFEPRPGWSGRIVTFFFVTIAWVLFRSDDMATASNLFAGLFGANGIVLPSTYFHYLGSLAPLLAAHGVRFEPGYLFLGIKEIIILLTLLAVVLFAPNALEIGGYKPFTDDQRLRVLPSWLQWQPTVYWGIGLSLLSILSLIMMSDAGEFLYFQF